MPKPTTKPLTAAELIARLREVPADASLYTYAGADGITVSAEWSAAPGRRIVAHTPWAVPSSGGPASADPA